MTGSLAQFSLRVLIAIALVVCALLIWQLQSVLLLIFAAVVVAVVLDAFGNALRKLAPVPEGVSRLLAGILIASVLIGAALLFGRQISAQLSQLGDTLPPAWENFVNWAGPDRVKSVIDDFAPDGTSLASMVQTMFGALTDALAGHRHVGEVRGEGLLCAVEFVADKACRSFFDAADKVGPKVAGLLAEEGVIARAMPQGDILGFAPPLCLTRAEADTIVDATKRAVQRAFD